MTGVRSDVGPLRHGDILQHLSYLIDNLFSTTKLVQYHQTCSVPPVGFRFQGLGFRLAFECPLREEHVVCIVTTPPESRDRGVSDCVGCIAI